MARALVPTRAATPLGTVGQLLMGAVTALWVAAADIGELLFTRWLCDGAAVAVACVVVQLAGGAARALRRAARSVIVGTPSGL